jgi:hypothetical protein
MKYGAEGVVDRMAYSMEQVYRGIVSRTCATLIEKL